MWYYRPTVLSKFGVVVHTLLLVWVNESHLGSLVVDDTWFNCCLQIISWTVRGSKPGGGRHFTPPSRPSPRPTQHPMQWVPGLSPGIKRPGLGVYHPAPSSAEFEERVQLYLAISALMEGYSVNYFLPILIVWYRLLSISVDHFPWSTVWTL